MTYEGGNATSLSTAVHFGFENNDHRQIGAAVVLDALMASRFLCW